MERLFPDTAKDMRVSDFVRNYNPAAGGCTMRYGTGGWAIDGALANIIKAYLVVQQADSGVTWLPTVWPNVKAQMQAIQTKFDVDTDGIIRAAQQNTYDTSMVEANTFIGSYYVVALKATAAMATLMGEPALATSLTARATLAAASYEKVCYNAKFGYYIADVKASQSANSYGPGCFVDQLCCIGLSSACGFGHIFDPAHEASARKAIVANNIVTKPPWNDMQKHLFDGDQGVTVCTYPNGKLGNGMRYDNLVSTGFTSPVVAGLVLDKNMDDAIKVAALIRKKQDGRNRSPWNEPECNILYSRTMAHWNMFDQACGFKYDSTAGAVGYDPRPMTSGAPVTDFKCFVTLEGGWGQFAQSGANGLPNGKASLTCLHGTGFTVKSFTLASSATTATATAGGAAVSLKAASVAGSLVLTFDSAVMVKVGAPGALMITIGNGHSPVVIDIDAATAATPPTDCCAGGACAPYCAPNGSHGSPTLRQRNTTKQSADSKLAAGEVGVTSSPSPLTAILAALAIFLLGVLSAVFAMHCSMQHQRTGFTGSDSSPI
jgi:hypothetical protein